MNICNASKLCMYDVGNKSEERQNYVGMKFIKTQCSKCNTSFRYLLSVLHKPNVFKISNWAGLNMQS